MEDQGWIKLHRKIRANWMMRDSVALHIWVYILTSCDREGRLRVSRYRTAETLGINPETFRSALERLKHHHQITTNSTNKFTLIQVEKWKDYQSSSPSKKENRHRPVTTYTRIENKEYNITTTEKMILKFLKGQGSVKNAEGYLRWLKSQVSEKDLVKLLNIEFGAWGRHIEEWKQLS